RRRQVARKRFAPPFSPTLKAPDLALSPTSAPASTPRVNPELIVFLHLPKTAGTSLNAIFRRQYRMAELHFVTPRPHEIRYGLQSRMEDFYSLPPEKVARIKMLRGHFVFGPPMPESASCITFLRK